MTKPIHIDRKALLDAIVSASYAISARDKSEIRKHCRLKITPESATVEATDGEIGICVKMPDVTSARPVDCLLPQRVASILRELNCEFIELAASDGGIEICSGFSDFKLSTADVADFPIVAHGISGQHFVVDGTWLESAIEKTVFACDVESTRFALCGICFNFCPKGEMVLAATDTRRLAIVTGLYECNDGPDVPAKAIIPTKAATIIGRSCGGQPQVKIRATENSVTVEAGNVSIFSRLVEGRFPNYRDVVPTDDGSVITLINGQFSAAIRQANVVINAESRGTDFQTLDGNITLMATGAEIGSSKVTLPVQVDGGDVATRLDGKFILQFLGTLDVGDIVSMKVIDEETAVLFNAGNYQYVVMPLEKD